MLHVARASVRSRRLLPVLLWASLIFWLSSQCGAASSGLSYTLARWMAMVILALPGLADIVAFIDLPGTVDGLANCLHACVRKGAHATEYAILALLLARWLTCTVRPMLVLPLTLALSAMYAIADELHQLLVPGRMASPVDILIDCLGAAIALAGWQGWCRLLQRGTRHASSSAETPDSPADRQADMSPRG